LLLPGKQWSAVSGQLQGCKGSAKICRMKHIVASRPNTYTGGSLERAGHLRADDAWIAKALNNPASRFVTFWNGDPVIDGAAENPRAAFTARPAGDAPWVFLGLQDGESIFAADISAGAEPADAVAEMWTLTGTLPPDDAVILATARAMLHWRANNRFCAVCGHANQPVRGGYVLHCSNCATEHFPRSDPAVIMLVIRGEKLLLGQSHRFPAGRNFFSTLAGFVEPGESLEDAVRREVHEETGVHVGAVHYHSSQPWPFPASLMLGFYAEGLSDEITLEVAEMRDARWFTRADINNREALGFSLPPHTSIARRLIEDWLSQA
jgi:NAD+ diphosphatase